MCLLLAAVGSALRPNPSVLLVVAGIVTGLQGRMSPVDVLDTFGTGFAGSRSVTDFAVVLPIIGLIEHVGLQEQSRRLIAKLSELTVGRLSGPHGTLRRDGERWRAGSWSRASSPSPTRA